MIVKELTQIGHPIIRAKSRSVKNSKSPEIQSLIRDLADSMHRHGLVGIAAPQIGKGLRVFVTEITRTKLRKNQDKKDIDKLRVYINPEIIKRSRKQIFGYEGCGSVASAQIFGKVKRPAVVMVKALDGKGQPFELQAERLLARVIQHEFDHIEGKIFLDRNPQNLMSRNEYLKKVRKNTLK